ncbi:MAG: hypothetical protein KGO48_17100 [Alphaproteobacteria bacterium]|nr:hypothetical protein [Alphaproteobacteria bacterium]
MSKRLRGFQFARIFAGSRSGNVAIIAGLSMTILVGFCGLGTDSAYWFYSSRSLHAAADIASFNAAVALNGGASGTALKTAATTAATGNGWNGTGTITVNNPPASGTHESTDAVEVILTETVPRYFTSIYSSTPLTIQARSVATKNGSHVACVLALSSTANQAINVSGGGNLSSPDCDIVSNSTSSTAINMSGSAKLSAPCIVTVGDASTTSGLTLNKCTSPTEHAPVATDPYASIPAPSIPSGPCIQLSGSPTTIQPGYYCKGLSVSWSGVTTFEPGLYYIDGGNFAISGQADVTGTGVTFYIAKGETAAISGGATANLTAPTSSTTWSGTSNSASTYSGLVFFGDRSATNGNDDFSGGSNQSITGAIYFPTENVTFSGSNASSSQCTQLIASTVTISGSAAFNNTCPGDGMSTINVQDGAPGSIQLAE